MRYVNRSHREILGSVFNQDADDLGGVAGYRGSGNILDQYPLLPKVLGMSAPEETHYQLGDCTVHHGYSVHGSINNSTDRDRCNYLFSYAPADTRCDKSRGHDIYSMDIILGLSSAIGRPMAVRTTAAAVCASRTSWPTP